MTVTTQHAANDLPSIDPSRFVEVRFPVQGGLLPERYAWEMFRVIQGYMPGLHGEATPERMSRMAPLSNLRTSQPLSRRGLVAVSTDPSAPTLMRLRLPADLRHAAGFLANVRLRLGSFEVTLGAPEVVSMSEAIPAGLERVDLYALAVCRSGKRGVRASRDAELDRVYAAVRLAFPDDGVYVRMGAETDIPVREQHWEPGWAVEVGNLTRASALRLMIGGMGTRRHQGGGWFDLGRLDGGGR